LFLYFLRSEINNLKARAILAASDLLQSDEEGEHDMNTSNKD